MIEISDDPARLDVARVHGWLASSYWSPGIARDAVERAIAGSHCVGAYRPTEEGGEQLGFARMITDHVTFAYLSDVWVDDAARGQGVARAMVRWFLDRPDYAAMRRLMLATVDAHGVYAPLGFAPMARPDRMMERLDPLYSSLLNGQDA